MADKVVQWVKQTLEFNSTGEDRPWSLTTNPGKSTHPITVDTDGSLYFTHIVANPVSGTGVTTTNDIVIGKMSSSGALQWIVQPTQLNTNTVPQDPSIAVGPTGVYVVYSTNNATLGNSNSGGNDVALAKFDKSGVYSNGFVRIQDLTL